MAEKAGAATPVNRDDPGTASDFESASTGELIGRAGEQLGDLVRGEMELARAELQVTVKRAVTGASLFGTAGVLTLYGGGALIATVILVLALVLSAWLAAGIVTVVLFVAAAVAAMVGKKHVEGAQDPVKHSVGNVQEDLKTVKREGP